MWTLDSRSPLPVWRCLPEPAGATLAFSTRRGGVSEGPYQSLNLGRSTRDRPDAVEENRRRLLAGLALDPSRLATAGQVHGTVVTRVSTSGLHSDCDGLLTTEPGIALAVTAADCVPILYAAPGAVAALHSGWRGTAEGAPCTALAAIQGVSPGSPDRITVHFGPCIRGCCYDVGPEVAGRFPGAALRLVGDNVHLDLPTAARLQLIGAGLPPESIHDTGACTACDSEWYFSHRRDRGLTGRQWGVAALSR